MLTADEIAGLLEEAADRRRAEVLRRFRRVQPPAHPAQVADTLTSAAAVFPSPAKPRRPARRCGRYLL